MTNMKPWYIYRISNSVNDKLYIGITTRPERRWREHTMLTRGAPLVKNSMIAHGTDKFSFNIIACACSQEDAYAVERLLIITENTKHPNGYNLSDGGEGASGFKQSLESVRKRANAIMGHSVSDETRAKIAASLTGRKSSPDAIKKISAANKGRKCPWTSAMLKEKHALGLINIPDNRGRKSPWVTERNKLRKGIKLTEHQKRNYGKGHRGKAQSQHHIAMRSAAQAKTLKLKYETNPEFAASMKLKQRENIKKAQATKYRLASIGRQFFIMFGP